MSRKLSVLLVQFILVTFILSTGVANGQMVGINRTDFEPHYRAQKTTMWCWASCAEMVLSYSGINLPQEAIVTRVKGLPVIQGGNPYEMIKSTNGIWYNILNKAVVVSGQLILGVPESNVLFNQLRNRRPVILTYQSNGQWIGHAVVLTGIDYIVNQNNTIMITRFYVFDPFSYTQSTDIAGRPYYAENPLLRYKMYDLQMTQYGLNLISSGFVSGTVTGMILMDASYLYDTF